MLLYTRFESLEAWNGDRHNVQLRIASACRRQHNSLCIVKSLAASFCRTLRSVKCTSVGITQNVVRTVWPYLTHVKAATSLRQGVKSCRSPGRKPRRPSGCFLALTLIGNPSTARVFGKAYTAAPGKRRRTLAKVISYNSRIATQNLGSHGFSISWHQFQGAFMS